MVLQPLKSCWFSRLMQLHCDQLDTTKVEVFQDRLERVQTPCHLQMITLKTRKKMYSLDRLFDC